jgi:enamine deaminase RidA (YjgF/YER057c/UK114 family)
LPQLVTAFRGKLMRMEPSEFGYGDLYAGVPYEYAAVASAAGLLFTAGACPLDADGAVVAPDDIGTQAGVAVDNLIAVLRMYGSDASDIVQTRIYVVGDRQDLVQAWDVIAARLAPHRPPSTLLGVTVLGYPDQLVEIEAVASLNV